MKNLTAENKLLGKRIETLDHDAMNQTEDVLKEKAIIEENNKSLITQNEQLRTELEDCKRKVEDTMKEKAVIEEKIKSLASENENVKRLKVVEQSISDEKSVVVASTTTPTTTKVQASSRGDKTDSSTASSGGHSSDDGEALNEEIERHTVELKVEFEASLKREKDKYEKVQAQLWEKEREVQGLKERQQQMMLEGGVSLRRQRVSCCEELAN